MDDINVPTDREARTIFRSLTGKISFPVIWSIMLFVVVLRNTYLDGDDDALFWFVLLGLSFLLCLFVVNRTPIEIALSRDYVFLRIWRKSFAVPVKDFISIRTLFSSRMMKIAIIRLKSSYFGKKFIVLWWNPDSRPQRDGVGLLFSKMEETCEVHRLPLLPLRLLRDLNELKLSKMTKERAKRHTITVTTAKSGSIAGAIFGAVLFVYLFSRKGDSVVTLVIPLLLGGLLGAFLGAFIGVVIGKLRSKR